MKLKVEQLAKIEEATIEVKNLTIFVGKNSTNKSYMAHTVYMVNKVLSNDFHMSVPETFKYYHKFFNQYLQSEVAQKDMQLLATINFTVSTTKDKIQLSNYDHFINRRKVIFDFSSIDISRVIQNIIDFIFKHIFLKLINQSFNINQTVIENIFFDHFSTFFKDDKFEINSHKKEDDTVLLLEEIFFSIFFLFDKHRHVVQEFYFPASRTGFVLAFDEIVSGVMRGQFSNKSTTTQMTEPMIDFLSNFSDIRSGIFDDDKKKKKFKDDNIVKFYKFIETRIIKGKIIEEQTTHSYTKFYLETTNNQKLDLHLSSSASVELLPLVIFLKHFSTLKDKLLVIEEPEAHLHPKAQIEMARLLVMLSNAGAKVLITTHSDYILNEISNCIKLSNATDEKKQAYLERYGLDEDTVISANDVSAYLFRDIEDKTIEVQELTVDKYGIANDNFDDILDELLERTDEINEMVL
ncbi:MAG: hypothetical protein KU38_08860 [Sulfurovum sp. FS08-3]|nr:MAG: hypothetical protein KU38_08860 [Sulfurovum sp. FS08-3]